ncbi:MAG: hypothetical protein ACMUIA_05830 [bacterium]
MKRIIALAVFMNLIAFPVHASPRFGFGIDFSNMDRQVDQDEEEQSEVGLRLYYENLMEKSIGIQVECGFSHLRYDRISGYSEYDYDGEAIEIAGLLKYYLPLKGLLPLFIGGGIGLHYQRLNDSSYERDSIELVEQATIGLQFSFKDTFSVFIEDRFLDELSGGHLRVGFYFHL